MVLRIIASVTSSPAYKSSFRGAGGRNVRPSAAHAAVAARPLGGALGVADARQRLGEQALQLLEPAALRAQLEQHLLRLEGHVERGGHPVGVELGEVVRLGALVGHLGHEVGVAAPGRLGGAGVGRGVVGVLEQLDVAGGVGQIVDAAQQPEGRAALHEHVHPPVLEALQHLGDARRAADLLQAVVGEPDDAELALLLDALADHELVALLEDVERHELVGDEHEPEREERKSLAVLGHRSERLGQPAHRTAGIGYNATCMSEISRRQLIVSGALAAGALAGSPRLLREALAAPARAGTSPYGPLGPPDANGLMLPPGFTSREIARGLSHVAGYPWPIFPDGQATFATADGG